MKERPFDPRPDERPQPKPIPPRPDLGFTVIWDASRIWPFLLWIA